MADGTYGAREDVMAPAGGICADRLRLRAGRHPADCAADGADLHQPVPQSADDGAAGGSADAADGAELSRRLHDRLSARARRLRQAAEHAAPRQKAAVRKAQKKSMVSELLGSGGDVHYGQRPQQEEHKKKELI